MADSISLVDLNTELGAYLRENRNILITQLLLGANFQEKFETYDGLKDELALPSLNMLNIVKPGLDKSSFSPTTNAIAFGARLLKVRDCKVDLQFAPAAMEKSWLGMSMPKGANNRVLPFAEYIFNYIIEQANQDVYLNAIYQGVYDAVGTTPGDTMDGFLKKIADAITAGKNAPVTTGVVTYTNVINQVRLVYNKLGEAYKAVPTECKVSSSIFDMYMLRFQELHGTNLDYVENKLSIAGGSSAAIYGTNCRIVREPGLGASQRIIITPKSNMCYGCDSIEDSTNIDTQVFDRTIKVLIDFKAGVEFKEVHDQALAVNEQA